jgi:hypothetical protein
MAMVGRERSLINVLPLNTVVVDERNPDIVRISEAPEIAEARLRR